MLVILFRSLSHGWRTVNLKIGELTKPTLFLPSAPIKCPAARQTVVKLHVHHHTVAVGEAVRPATAVMVIALQND